MNTTEYRAALAAIILTAIGLAGCAHDGKRPHYMGSHGHESPGVTVVREYVPVHHVEPQEWGRYAFVPGYAQQGVVVTPSRVWNYGQGRGWGDAHRTDTKLTIREMTGRTNPEDRRPCRDRIRAPQPMDNDAKYQWGYDFTRFSTDAEVRQQPLTGRERGRMQAYQRAGCTAAEARRAVIRDRLTATNYARPIAASEKGGQYHVGDPGLPHYNEPPTPDTSDYGARRDVSGKHETRETEK